MSVFTNHMFTLTFLYFIQGLPYGFQSRFMPVYLRSKGISLTNVGLFKLLLAPWLCKALWAPLVDKYGTKHNWLVWSISGLCITCALASLVPPDYLFPLCIIILFLNISAATQDIAVDSIAVAILSADELGTGNTAQVVGYKLGSIFGGGILVWFMDYIGWMGLFSLLTILYIEALLFVIMSPSFRNAKVKHCPNLSQETPKSSSSESKSSLAGGFSESEPISGASQTLKQNSSTETACSHECCEKNSHIKSNNLDHAKVEECGDSPSETSSVSSKPSTSSPKSILRQRKKEKAGNNDEDISDKCPEQVIADEKEDDKSDKLDEDDDVFDDSLNEDYPNWLNKLPLLGNLVKVQGTGWMMVYVLIYKLGEQGALGMLPLFLIDQDISRRVVSFWTGILGQIISLAGSVLGGWIMMQFVNVPTHLILQQLGLCRLIPLGIQLWVVAVWQLQLAPSSGLFWIAIVSMVILLFISGIITTVTFTFMMQCSKMAPSNLQATHYTTIATLEVFGKLGFMSVIGWGVDVFGYEACFLLFVALSVLVLPWLNRCPASLQVKVKER